MTTSGVDLSDVQGLVRFGYKQMTEAAYVLVRVKNREAARAWLRAAPITSAVTIQPPPSAALNVAATAEGLGALGVPRSILAGFSAEFLSGMTQESRSRRLGDVGSNAPSHWMWGMAEVPHFVVMCFARPVASGGPGLEAFMRDITGARWNEAFDVMRRLDTTDLGGVEPFGFTDGISQPQLDWDERREAPSLSLDYGNVVALGELLLGYKNEYAKYTDRPIVDARGMDDELLPAEDSPEKRDVGRNGTYLVLRQLRQDVRGFWRFVNARAASTRMTPDQLAAAFVGRTRAGEPLVPIRPEPIDGIGLKADEVRLNQFTFDDDPAGARCPFGSHVRRTNPRNADLERHPRGVAKLMAMLGLGRAAFRDDLMSPVRFHRILRRGREYGPGLAPAEARVPEPADDPERGLHFVCLNANISRQFEFLQNAWAMSTKFSGLSGESDPLLGNRQPVVGCPATDGFTAQRDGTVCRHVGELPQFITVRGGAYFFLPSIRAIRFLTSIGGL